MRLQNDRNDIRIEIDSLFGRAEIYEKERRKRMRECKKEITREIYDAAGGENGNVLPSKYREEIFSMSELMGYGVYYPTVYEEDGKYYCRFYMGDSCD